VDVPRPRLNRPHTGPAVPRLRFVLREVEAADRDDLLRLAEHLDTLNLPHDAAALNGIIEHSIRSFEGTLEDPLHARYLFVLEDLAHRRVVGTSMIIAAHGTMDDPHHYLQLDVEERYSSTMRRVVRHKTLRFRTSYTPHTELGALILDPEYRGRPEKLGKMLSFVRFLFIGAYPGRFADRLEAELLPPFDPDGSSKLWEWLGRKCTGLSYQEADRLSRENHEFMRALFPREKLYVTFMPQDVQELIGAVGPNTKGVARMLERIGFQFNGNIDPFDGGPHYAAATREIQPVADTRHESLGPWLDGRGPTAFIGRASAPGRGGFRAVVADHREEEGHVRIPEAAGAVLGLQPDDTVLLMPVFSTGSTKPRL